MKFTHTKQLFFALAALLIASLACSQFASPVTTSTSQPEATAVEVASPEPTQEVEQKPELGEVILEDDFSDNSNNWYVGADTETDSTVEDGQFKVKVLAQDTSFSFDPPVSVSDADISFDTTFNGGKPANAGYGLLCHAIDADNRYRIRIAPDGFYAINKTVKGETTDLVNWTKTGVINQGIGVVNNIRAICSENHITLYVNDIFLSDVVDSDLSGGNFALLTAYYKNEDSDTAPVEVGFSNLVVRKPLAWERPAESLLSDSFDNNNNGWDVFENEGNSAQIVDGQMVMKVVAKDSFYSVWPQITLANVDMTFDATIQEGTVANAGYGASCRFSNVDNLYSFRIDGEGYYTLAKKVDGNWETIIDWTSSNALNLEPGATNHIRVVCSDSKLELYANDQLLISSQDTTLTGSGFSLHASHFSVDDQPITVTFDNMEVKYP
jgi:hypothetical protein